MATLCTIGTVRNPWKKETATTNASFGSGFLNPGSAPSTNATNGIFVVTNTDEFNNVAAMFYGSGSADQTATVRLWGVNAMASPGSDYLGFFLGELTITLSSTAASVASSFSGYKFVDHISVNQDASNQPPGIRVIGDVDDKIAAIMFDAMGFQYIVIELIKGTFTTSVGVAWKVI